MFIQPPVATVGLTEEQAREKIAGDVDVYVSKFRAMKSTITGGKFKTLIKLLVEVSTDKVRRRSRSPPPPSHQPQFFKF